MKIKLGVILIKLRKEKNLTQHEIANALYVSRATYSYWENDASEMSMSKLILLLQTYDISVHTFFEMIKKENDMNLKVQDQESLCLQEIKNELLFLKDLYISSSIPIL